MVAGPPHGGGWGVVRSWVAVAVSMAVSMAVVDGRVIFSMVSNTSSVKYSLA